MSLPTIRHVQALIQILSEDNDYKFKPTFVQMNDMVEALDDMIACGLSLPQTEEELQKEANNLSSFYWEIISEDTDYCFEKFGKFYGYVSLDTILSDIFEES